MSFAEDFMAGVNTVTLRPDPEGNVRCPLCHRTCALPYFVGQHVDHHRYTIDGRQFAEIEVAVVVAIRDRYQQPTVVTGADPQETP
jgi:hypothetical protein